MKDVALIFGRQRRSWVVLVPLLVGVWTQSTDAADWPQYRGATHDAVSADPIQRNWTGSVTNPVWRLLLTNSLGSFAVSGGRALNLVRRARGLVDQEVCVALDANDGRELWATPIDDAFYPHGGVGFDDGPRSTPTIDGDAVFVLSSYLKLHRLNATNGAVVWSKDLLALYGGTVIGWQNAASPVLEDGLIYLNANCATQTLMALRASDGSLAWRSQDEAMTHSSPVLATIHGVRQVIFAAQSGLVSLDPHSGQLLWKFPYPFFYGTCIGVSPVVYEDLVFISGAQVYDMGSVVAQIDLAESGWAATQLWANITFASTLSSHWMTPVCHRGFLYGQFGSQQFDSVNAQLKCVELRTGAQCWSANGFGRGGTVLVGDDIVSLTERGQLVLVEANPNAYTEVGRFNAIPYWNGNTNKCWNVPAVAGGRFYLRSTAYAVCLDLSSPRLLLEAPELIGPDQFRLTIRTANGVPLTAERLAGLEVFASTGLGQNLADWLKLTNTLELIDGVVHLNFNPGTTTASQFFIATEPRP